MVSLTVNGQRHDLDVDPETPLLYVLRDDLKLNGAKYGCGLGQCGSCTVMVDAEAAFSCLVPLLLLEGKQITTLEGLGTIDNPGPMQRAFIAEQAAQCGYCIPGMMMRAQALLQKNPQASDAEIRTQLQPNLCRCGTHMRITRGEARCGDDADGSGQRPGRPLMTGGPLVLSRRGVLAGAGALLVSFSASHLWAQTEGGSAATPPAAPPAPRPGSLKDTPLLDAWIRIDAKGEITVFTGKAELGQGIRTAIQQVAAEELDVPFEVLKLITAETGLTPNEGYTAGSQSMPESATAVRHAAAQVREILIAEAAKRAGLPEDQLRAENGAVVAAGGQRFAYGDLVSGTLLHIEAQPQSRLRSPETFKVMGKSVPRVDIPAKVTGGPAYVHDMRPQGMVHGRVVRPPSYGARLTSVDVSAVERMPGVVAVVRDGSFLGVAAEREFQAIKAMRALAEAAQWEEKPGLPNENDLASAVTSPVAQTSTIHDKHDATPNAQKTLEATYTKPYVMHGSIGPSCAVALANADGMTIWSHTQGVYPDRGAIAELLGLPPEQLRVIHVPG